MKIIDAHTHIFNPVIINDRNEFLSDKAFATLYSDAKSKITDREGLLRGMDSAGIEYAVALGFPWMNDEYRKLHNDYTVEAKTLSGGRIIPFAAPPRPGNTEALDEFFRSVSGNGFAGIGEIASYSGSPDTAYINTILKKSGEAGLPVSIHVSEPVGRNYPGKKAGPFSELIDIIKDNPATKVILAHWGGGLLFYELMPEIAEVLSNTWYDTAASPFLYSDRIYSAALKLVSSKKILFGTDYPLIPYSRCIEPVKTETGNTAARDILYNNSAALFKLK